MLLFVGGSFCQFLLLTQNHHYHSLPLCKLNNESILQTSFNIWSGFQAREIDLSELDQEESDALEMMKSFIFMDPLEDMVEMKNLTNLQKKNWSVI